jgi:hypothetical protein
MSHEEQGMGGEEKKGGKREEWVKRTIQPNRRAVRLGCELPYFVLRAGGIAWPTLSYLFLGWIIEKITSAVKTHEPTSYYNVRSIYY